jgi:hypothetical protein
VHRANLQEELGNPGTCAQCGADVLVKCRQCGLRIRGRHFTPGRVAFTEFQPPPFCDGCGSAHPWATRQDRIYELENLLDQEEIDDADALWVRERLAVLREPGLSETDEIKLWEGIKSKAPGLITGAGKAVVSAVTTVVVRRALGL